MTLPVLSLILIALTVIFWVILPYFEKNHLQEDEETPSSTQYIPIEQIIDLEYDYHTGKIDEETYRSERDRLLGSK